LQWNWILLWLLVANLYFIISQLYKESQNKIIYNFITIALFITILTYLNPVWNNKVLANTNNMMGDNSMSGNNNMMWSIIKLHKAYTSPWGTDKVTFDISMSGDKIIGIKINEIKTNPTSKVYIWFFNDNIWEVVKWKTIKEIRKIDTIWGASLTTNAFKEALKNL